ncbi:MAG: hypothetical protein QOI63_1547 [Thermoplasmata archaeon]|jgi:hypothetical protein|nr:hypothetical protein [Thermoplasmata archaeon]
MMAGKPPRTPPKPEGKAALPPGFKFGMTVIRKSQDKASQNVQRP